MKILPLTDNLPDCRFKHPRIHNQFVSKKDCNLGDIANGWKVRHARENTHGCGGGGTWDERRGDDGEVV